MIEVIKKVGIRSAGAVLGAVILPELASTLVGGLGMIAAAGAVSGCFYICALTSISVFFNLLTHEQQRALANNIKQYPIASRLTALSLTIGLFVASIFAASIVMGQAFLPLLACTALGTVIIGIGLGLILSLFSPTDESNHDLNTGFRI